MLNYFLSNKAVEDLSKIWDYTYDTWSENQADTYYNRLINFCKDISDNPKIGKNYNEIDPTILGYHANHHIIFYRITTENKIEIVRILHENMDLKNRIRE